MSERKSNIAFGMALVAVALSLIMTVAPVEPAVIIVSSIILAVLGVYIAFFSPIPKR